jgi:hypothetical protein
MGPESAIPLTLKPPFNRNMNELNQVLDFATDLQKILFIRGFVDRKYRPVLLLQYLLVPSYLSYIKQNVPVRN